MGKGFIPAMTCSGRIASESVTTPSSSGSPGMPLEYRVWVYRYSDSWIFFYGPSRRYWLINF